MQRAIKAIYPFGVSMNIQSILLTLTKKPLDGVLLKYEFHDQYSQDKTNIPHDELIAKPTITREYVVNSDPGYVIKMFQSKFKYEVLR